MSREIKFRAWDYTSNVMRNDITEMVFNSDGTLNQIDVETGADILFPEKECVLMQYTGLKDKNGVEIYEGDIVRVLMNHIADLAPELPDQEYTYKVWFDEKTACFKIDDMTLNYGMLRDQFNKLEVIGNIYENPELLEPFATQPSNTEEKK